ncbi:MAG: prepilin-type N-terminal cleavage/methylation domain-containing protein [Limnobacter sp.]|nr:prepilin-type N-terminal cleavage/methylation domain-containing protein [Limnobacter sp.]
MSRRTITRRGKRPLRTAAGFTILELLVAVTLLAVLAVLSWRGMAAVINGRDAIVERSDELRMLTTAMSQMEEDLRRSWPVRLLGLAQPTIGFSLGTDREPPALQLLREAGGEGPTQVQNVSWRLRDGVLERGFSAWMLPLPDSEAVVAPELTWQPLAAGVEALEFRGWLAGRGWIPAPTLATEQARDLAADAAARGAPGGVPGGSEGGGGAPQLPGRATITGVEMTMVRNGERILRVFAVAD